MGSVIWRIWTVSIVSTIIISMAEARQCYVCGYGSTAVFQYSNYVQDTDLFFPRSQNRGGGGGGGATVTTQRPPNFKDPPPACPEFDHSDSLGSELIRECPEEYMGCLTQIDGNEVMRTCDPLALNDCKVANKVTYCYCNGDLCNSLPPSSFSTDDQSNYDASAGAGDEDDDTDEDYGDADESSGMRPTAASPFPKGAKSDQLDARGTVVFGRGRSTPGAGGGSWSTAVGGQGLGMNANSHTPFHYPTTIGPDTSAGSRSFSRWSIMGDAVGGGGGGLVAPLARPIERVLIGVALFIVRNRLALAGSVA